MSILQSSSRFLFRMMVRGIGRLAIASIQRKRDLFEAATRDPLPVQRGLLQGILARQADTQFGRDHHFRDIRTREDFCHHIPITGYEAIAPYVARMMQGDFRALVSDDVHMFALSSGTTSEQKHIPV